MKKVLVMILIGFVSACASVGTKKPGVATLQNQKVEEDTRSFSLIFEEVDGKKLTTKLFGAPNRASHYVKPGKRNLDIKVTYRSEKIDLLWASKFRTSAELRDNEIYTVKASEKNWCIKMEVLNSKNEIVAGPEFSKLSPFLSLNHMRKSWLMSQVREILDSATCI